MKKQLITLLTIIISASQIITVHAAYIPQNIQQQANDLALDAQSAILIDASTGDILYKKEIDKAQYPASITKLMTVLLALEYGNLDETMHFSHDAVFSIEPGSSHIAIDVDEEITMRQGLYAIMLQSANEVSNGVAEHIDGSMDAFAQHMTSRAKELGCTNTNFVNANGLHNENHYTSAHDMALIAKELMKFDFFKELMLTKYYEIPPTNKQPETRYLYGQNQLIKDSSIFYYDKCIGGKTGFTNEAGNTLVAFAQDGNTTLISVVLKSTGYGEYTDTATLFDFGFNNFETKTIAKKGDICTTVNVTEETKKGVNDLGTINAIYSDNVVVSLPKDFPLANITTHNQLPQSIEAPVTTGQPLGNAIFEVDGTQIASANIVSQNQLPLPSTAINESDTKNPISIRLIAALLALTILTLAAIRFSLSKIEYERKKRIRKARILKLRETTKEHAAK
ncbi:MAG: D-alanyl-D-alanine carboxypeptidase family protein [Lachnospiraceae bacterium]|nr:D-alanyl-D-alanine carboxypeptidase family protein [Lachnospiraceae bacterium]